MLTDRPGNHPNGIEYGTSIFIGTSFQTVSGFANAIIVRSVLFLTPSHVTNNTVKAAVFIFTGDTATGT